jgi:5-methylcytosine-specific restriction endonuclease McrA
VSTGRNTTVRDRDRRALAREKPPCHICGGEIDYELKYPHLDSFVVDHVIPIARGGLDVIENKAASHSRCNRAKSDKLADEIAASAPRTFVTSRTW